MFRIPELDSDRHNRYFLLPTKSHIHVYSARTSLLVRSLFITQADSVTSCITCPSDPEEVLVSTYRGTITKYNWATGRKLQKWKTTSGLLRIYGLPASNSNDTGSSILTINQRPGGERDISYFRLPASPDMPVKEVVLRSKQRIASTLVTLEGGKLLVGFGGDKVMLGFAQDLESGECMWRDVNVPGMVVSVDARGQAASINTTKTGSAVDVVVGLQDGAIIILDDILTWLTQKEKATKGIDRISRRLHWHRGAVSAVKWSRDGAWRLSLNSFLFHSLLSHTHPARSVLILTCSRQLSHFRRPRNCTCHLAAGHQPTTVSASPILEYLQHCGLFIWIFLHPPACR